MKKYITKSQETCLRSMLFSPFNENNEIVQPKIPGHECCSYCSVKCKCLGGCQSLIPPIPSIEVVPETKPETPVRNVSRDDETLVKDLLLEYHEEQSCNIPLLAPAEIVTGVTDELVSKVIEHLPYIDSVAYVRNVLNVSSIKLAREISVIVKEVFIDDDDGVNNFADLVDDIESDRTSDDEMILLNDFSYSSICSDESYTSLDDSDF